jgi:hypothetical protein
MGDHPRPTRPVVLALVVAIAGTGLVGYRRPFAEAAESTGDKLADRGCRSLKRARQECLHVSLAFRRRDARQTPSVGIRRDQDPYAYPYGAVSPRPGAAHRVMVNLSAEYATTQIGRAGTRKRCGRALKNCGVDPRGARRSVGVSERGVTSGSHRRGSRTGPSRPIRSRWAW